MIFVSPQPNTWYAIYLRLKSQWEKDVSGGVSPPPMALLLSGWTMSNDQDKLERWQTTLKWASESGYSHLIPALQAHEQYLVSELSDYRPFYHESKTIPAAIKPSKEEVRQALTKLNEGWSNILDENFGRNTVPVSFSGKKARQLWVSIKSGYLPPWGSWTDHLANGRPSKFSALRKQVNSIIAPLDVDHIVFKEEKE